MSPGSPIGSRQWIQNPYSVGSSPTRGTFPSITRSADEADALVLVNIRFLLRVPGIAHAECAHVRHQHTQASGCVGGAGAQPSLREQGAGGLPLCDSLLAGSHRADSTREQALPPLPGRPRSA
ncbi:hypothetical protein SHJGH_3251 [Streptomyces hygroscopicus subsp. jinggangensis TL01]|nr:hypothetical protein SHJGH_3251 [Streptomyces hygroscopicus subsp. jinggangensis TL01]